MAVAVEDHGQMHGGLIIAPWSDAPTFIRLIEPSAVHYCVNLHQNLTSSFNFYSKGRRSSSPKSNDRREHHIRTKLH